MNFFKKNRYIIFILAISIFVYWKMISLSIFSSSDWIFEYHETLRQFPDFSIWNSYSLGGVNVLLWRLIGPNSLLFGLFGYFNLDSNIADKFLIIWPWIFLSGISSYFLVKEITKSNIGGVIGFFVLSFNTYFLAINTQGHLMLSTASIFSNLAILFFIRLLEQKNLKNSILTALFLFLSGINDLRILYITIWILFFYFIYFITFIYRDVMVSNHKKENEGILKNFFYAGIPVVILILLNIFWILPSMLTESIGSNDILNRSLFGNNYSNLSNAITLFHPFWINGKTEWFTLQNIPFYFWLIPFLATFGLILHRKNKKIMFFGLLSLIGVFFSKQAGEPFTGFYEWMFLHFPGFNAFREATKFYYVVALGYSVLIGALGAYVFDNFNKNNFQKNIKWLLLGVISMLFFYNTFPIITGEIGNLFIKKNIPNDYIILKDFILRQNGSFRSLYIPRSSKWGIYTNQKPILSAIGVAQNEWGDIFKREKLNMLSDQEKITLIFKESFSQSLLNNSSIKYVIIPPQDRDSTEDFFKVYGGNINKDIRNWYVRELEKITWLKKVNIGTSELLIYENSSYKEHIYSTKELDSVYKNIPAEKISWETIGPTKYVAHLKNIKGINYLNFSEKFHPGWSIWIGDFNWISTLIHSENFINREYHTRNDTNLNSFLIDTNYIKEKYPDSYKENIDGSIDIDITIYFKAQAYFYLGLIISSTTLVLMIGFLIRSSRKKEEDFNSAI